MTDIEIEDDKGYFIVGVYEHSGDEAPIRVVVKSHARPSVAVVMLRFPVTEENLLDLRGANDDGIVTSARLYDLITEAVYEAGYGRLVP